MSAMTVTNNGSNTTNPAGVNDPLDSFNLFHSRPPIWSTSNQPGLDHQWNESLFSPTHRPWPSEPFGSDIGSDELPYPRQLNHHQNQNRCHLNNKHKCLGNNSLNLSTASVQLLTNSNSTNMTKHSVNSYRHNGSIAFRLTNV